MLQIVDESIAEDFVKNLLIRINNNFPYCLARGTGHLYPVKSDTDIIIERKDYKKFLTFLTGLQLELNFYICNIIKRQYVYTHILYHRQLKIYLQIDTEFDFDWWSFRVLNARDILNRSKLRESVRYASEIDSSFMKFYRSLLWGGKLKNKYKNSIKSFDLEFVNNFTYLKTPTHLKHNGLRNYYSNHVIKRLRKTRRSLILNNLINFGLIKTFYRFIIFIFFEFRLIFSNNGTSLFMHGDTKTINEVRNSLEKYISICNAPFKDIFCVKNISYLKKRKLLRDSNLLISNSIGDSNFQLYSDKKSFYLKKKGVLIYESKCNDFVVNDLIKIIYSYR